MIAGSVPIGIVGLAARGLVGSGALRSLVTVAIALIAFSPVLVLAERRATQSRGEQTVGVRDAVLIGTAQCLALVPGVSRSGATISAGLLLGLDRVAATRLSFFLSIPALTAAGLLELPSALGQGVGLIPTAIGTAVSSAVAYGTVALLLRFVAGHSIAAFVPYRVALGTVVLSFLALRTVVLTVLALQHP